MASKWLACLAATIVLGSCQGLSCYNCDPSFFVDNCRNPSEKVVTEEQFNAVVDTLPSICLSAYLKFTDERDAKKTGIYRGCKTLRPDIDDYCDYYKQLNDGPKITVVSCITCNSTKCNSQRFKDDGTIGGASASTAIYALVFSSVFVLLLTVF